jgi:hypothetical protein
MSVDPPKRLHAPNEKDGPMSSFSSMRRNFLRTGSIGVAAIALPGVAMAVTSDGSANAVPQDVFDVRNFGATGDGKTLDTAAVNAAIDAAASAGGGMVVFPAGAYLCFSIHLKSQVHLYLQQGSAIVAADSPLPGEETGYRGGIYDIAEPKTDWDAYQDYGHNHWHNSLMWGEDIHDISITGPGLIWGKGLSNGRGRKGDGAPFVADQRGVANKAIALKNCRNVVFRDFSVLKAGHFGLLLTGVDNVTIDNLKIDTDRDGMDIDCCQNVRVSNCTVNSPWDDGICPKSSFALGYARPTRNLTITNCYVTGTFEMGTVLDGTFKKYGPEYAGPRTDASNAEQSPMAGSSTSQSPIVCSRAVRAMRSKRWMAPYLKTSRLPIRPCATLCRDRSSCALVRDCAGRRKARRWER